MLFRSTKEGETYSTLKFMRSTCGKSRLGAVFFFPLGEGGVGWGGAPKNNANLFSFVTAENRGRLAKPVCSVPIINDIYATESILEPELCPVTFPEIIISPALPNLCLSLVRTYSFMPMVFYSEASKTV